MIGARFAALAARLAAGGEGGRARRPARGDRGAAGGDARGARGARRRTAEALARLGAALGQVLQRLDAQAEVLHTHIAREDMVAGRLAELGAHGRGAGGLRRDARADAGRVPRPDREPRGAAARRRAPPRPDDGDGETEAPDRSRRCRGRRWPCGSPSASASGAARRAARPAAPGAPRAGGRRRRGGARGVPAGADRRRRPGGGRPRRPSPRPSRRRCCTSSAPSGRRGRPPETDLDRLPGAGPGLVGALRRAGLARLADVAPLAPEALAARLGPIGRLVPAEAWVAAAREAAAAGLSRPARRPLAAAARRRLTRGR